MAPTEVKQAHDVMNVLKEIVLCVKLQIIFYQRCKQLQSMSLDEMLNSNRLKDNVVNDGWSSFCLDNYIIDWKDFKENKE